MGGYTYLAEFTIFGFSVSAAGYELPEHVGGFINIIPNPDTIGATYWALKEGTIHLVSACSSICRDSIPILHYQYPSLGIYE